MSGNLEQALTDAVLRQLSGEQSYQEGVAYFSQDCVELLKVTGESIQAIAGDSQDYQVRLAASSVGLDYKCDCPSGSQGAFCQHCVAVGLAFLARPVSQTKQPVRTKAKTITLVAAQKVLRSEDKETLVKQLFEWAKDDKQLRDRIILYAARRSDPESNAAAVRKSFEKAIQVRSYVKYRQSGEWARNVQSAVDSIQHLLDDGHSAAVIEICESALLDLCQSIQSVEDSDGHFAKIKDRLVNIHKIACDESRPDPAALAKRLLDIALGNRFDVFQSAAETYADVLGERGLRRYKELAQREWDKVPVRTAGQERYSRHDYSHITQVMESLARSTGDVEQLVEVMSRNLTEEHCHLRIAEVYRDAGLYDKALTWAETGLASFPKQHDSKLREFAAEEYHRRKQHAKAIDLMWKEFFKLPHLGTFRKLKLHADRAGEWPEWRGRALDEIRLRISTVKNTRIGCDHSMLVEFLLDEGNLEEAWKEALDGGCTRDLHLQLTILREAEHPLDALPVYRNFAENAIVNGRYDDGVEWLERAAAVLKRLDRSAEIPEYLERIYLKYKAKKNFTQRFNERREWLYL